MYSCPLNCAAIPNLKVNLKDYLQAAVASSLCTCFMAVLSCGFCIEIIIILSLIKIDTRIGNIV